MPACRVGPLDLSRARGRVVSRYSDVSPTTTTSPWLAGWLLATASIVYRFAPDWDRFPSPTDAFTCMHVAQPPLP